MIKIPKTISAKSFSVKLFSLGDNGEVYGVDSILLIEHPLFCLALFL